MRSIPTVTKNLLIINVLAFAAMYVFRSQVDLNDILGLHFFLASDFRIYQLVTYMFMHASFEHIFFNMFALWMFGCVVERVWGPKKFLFYYISCGIGAGLFQELAQYGSYMVEGLAAYDSVSFDGMRIAMGDFLNKWTTVGASGAVYALLLAFGMIFPEERIFIFPLPIPIKAKWFVIFYAGLSLVMALTTTGGNVAHFAHLGGMVFGFFMIRYWKHHPYGGSSRSDGQQFFDNLREKWEEHAHKKADNTKHDAYDERKSDWDYNAQKQREQEEIDKILDKIRKSGYDSLTQEEKQKLFDSSNRH
ncbi:rhomboid family intramembrane serine protease [Hoylesella buccalis]|uniref:rhomboid family intramembrane serine protease n=1 Tax=Hoylesella buccalis TaxID=28127 RepID=UPI00399282F4